jgi:hypothetical protein
MLRPMPLGPILPKTVRAAALCFPGAIGTLRVTNAWEMLFTDDAFLAPPHTWATGSASLAAGVKQNLYKFLRH